MWIELLKPVDGHDAGKFIEVDDKVGRSYIEAGLAKDGGDGPDVVILQRSIDTFRTELKGFVDQTAKAITDAASQVRTAPRIQATASEVDKKRTLVRYVHLVERALAFNDQAAADELALAWDAGGYGCKRAMAEGTGNVGGFTTPVLYESTIFEVAAEMSVLVSGATEVPLGARDVEWPALDQYSVPAAGQSAFFGGMQVFRKGELQNRTEIDPKLKKVKLVAQDLTAYTEISRDYLQDSTVPADALVTRLMGKAIGWREDWEAINGTGAMQFLGYMNAPATILLTRNTGGNIVYQDVFKMRTRMLPAPESPCWITHPYAVYALETLQDASGRFIFIPYTFMPTAGMQSSPGNTQNYLNPVAGVGGGITMPLAGFLLGWPLYVSEKLPPLGTPGDLALVDRKKYLVGRRSGLEIGLSEHYRFQQDEIAIRAKIRNDGQPWLKAPITLADGTGANQVSGFVVLN